MERLARTDVMHDQNIGMIQRTCRTRFLLESVQTRCISGEARWKNFDCDITTKLHIPSLVDFSHPARTDLRADFITTQFCTGLDHGLLACEFNAAAQRASPTPENTGRRVFYVTRGLL
jgi:hypothetical protein